MGYEVEMKGPGAGTVNGFFALAGCRNPTDSQEPDCEGAWLNRAGKTMGDFGFAIFFVVEKCGKMVEVV